MVEVDGQLRRAVAAGDAAAALIHLDELLRLAEASSSPDIAPRCLLAVGHAAPVLASCDGLEVRRLADAVVRLVEPWFGAPIDEFAEVAEGARHAALHPLMLAAARAGDFETCLIVRDLEDRANERCFERWAREGIASSPGSHSLYPSAYGTRQLVELMALKSAFAKVPSLLDKLSILTARFQGDRDREVADAFASEEVAVLAAVLSAPAPPEFAQRCRERCAAIAAFAVPEADWPRTRGKLAVVAGARP